MNEHELHRVPILAAGQIASRSMAASAEVDTAAPLERVRRGLYVLGGDWPDTERERRHFVRMQAVVASTSREPVFSHRSAAVLWGIPVAGKLSTVDLIAAGRVGVRSQRGITWHHDRVDDADIVQLDGFHVTGLARTLLDLACSSSFAASVAAVDFGLRPTFVTPLGTRRRGVEREALHERSDAARGRRGIRSARSAIEFGDPRSGSAGESVSRANMHLMRFPPPKLQVAFRREDGGNDIVDFDWPEFGRFGEFDGRLKYLDPTYMNGRTIEDVILDEKAREDRVRRYRPGAIRWDWDIAISPQRLARRLIHHGLHPLT